MNGSPDTKRNQNNARSAKAITGIRKRINAHERKGGTMIIDLLDPKIASRIKDVSIHDALLGYLRYEHVRKLSVHAFSEIWKNCLHNGERFDDEIDRLIEGAL